MPFNCVEWSFTIQIKRSYPRQHNFALKCIKVTKKWLAKLSETTHACEALHKLKQEKKHLTLDVKNGEKKTFSL